ncbi:hypothetical protein GCM10010211_82540 [Streptomyces albospinus]|uniref:Uncharacterized protein n=1 Tax=Streptomyces albospinus TaxID=285515 RepID=A0ABQ2VPC7_9ACTN|nr:hypothetical protein [Streptomyces albospinus]GGV02719.1 hypothetical protein GCM10010211_82540 [Streptomyces albospinus]
MKYTLRVKTADSAGLIAAIEADAGASDSGQAQVSADGIGLQLDPMRTSGVDLVTLLLTIPVGVTVEVAADRIKKYLGEKDEDHRIRKETIGWQEETVDADGNVKTNWGEYRIELDES